MLNLSLMKRWGALVSVLFFVLIVSSAKVSAADEITTTQIDSETTVTTVISEEVGAFDGDTGIKRQDQQQAFDKADNLDQSWKDEVAKLKVPETTPTLVVDQVNATDAQNFEFSDPNDASHTVSVVAENVDMKDAVNVNDLGTKSAEAYQYKPKLDLPGSGANTYNGDTMQDFAPVPRKYAGQYYANESQNGFGDQNNYRNGLRFTFSEDVSNFGVWVGDVETRTDGEGTPALLRLYDANQNLILEQIIKPNSVHTDGDQNQTSCGTENTTTSLINTTGCGHNTTRYIGFAANMPIVRYMLIIVGDDDAFPGTNENNGNTEHISFMAPTMSFLELKSTPNFGSALSLCDGQNASSSNKNYCLNLNFSQDVEGDLNPEDFNLSLSSSSASISSVTRTSASSFQLNLRVDDSVDFDISEITLSLKADVISRVGNNLSTNLESNTLSLAYTQPDEPVDPIDPVEPVEPTEGEEPGSNSNEGDNLNHASEIDLDSKNNNMSSVTQASGRKGSLSLVASVNYGELAQSGQNRVILILITLGLLTLSLKRIYS